MRIAQVAPLYESVPPQGYGGTERVVSYLTEELVRQGHEVTLFASGDSVTAAELIAPCAKSLRLDANCWDQFAAHLVMLEMRSMVPAQQPRCPRFSWLKVPSTTAHPFRIPGSLSPPPESQRQLPGPLRSQSLFRSKPRVRYPATATFFW